MYRVPGDMWQAVCASQIRKRCQLLGQREAPGARALQLASSLVLRHALLAVIFLVVISSPAIWSSPVYYLAATNGIAYINWLNLEDILSQSEFAGLKACFIDTAHRFPRCGASASWSSNVKCA